jgi:hypothetical protein
MQSHIASSVSLLSEAEIGMDHPYKVVPSFKDLPAEQRYFDLSLSEADSRLINH